MTPGPGDYASASWAHQQRAQQFGYEAQRAQELASWQAANGNHWGAAQAQAAARNRAEAAQAEQAHANRDSWLGALGF